MMWTPYTTHLYSPFLDIRIFSMRSRRPWQQPWNYARHPIRGWSTVTKNLMLDENHISRALFNGKQKMLLLSDFFRKRDLAD